MGKLHWKTLTFVFTAVMCANVFLQSHSGSITLQGVVLDSADNEPLIKFVAQET